MPMLLPYPIGPRGPHAPKHAALVPKPELKGIILPQKTGIVKARASANIFVDHGFSNTGKARVYSSLRKLILKR